MEIIKNITDWWKNFMKKVLMPITIALSMAVGASCSRNVGTWEREPKKQKEELVHKYPITEEAAEQFDRIFNVILSKSGMSKERLDSLTWIYDWVESGKARCPWDSEAYVYTNNRTWSKKIVYFVPNRWHAIVVENGDTITCYTNLPWYSDCLNEEGLDAFLQCLRDKTCGYNAWAE